MRKRPQELDGINIKEIARICRVSLKTATRWKSGQTVPPHSALMLLAGDLGCLDPQWRGWVVRGGELISPEGWAITVNDVLASPLLRAQLAVYQAELRSMREAAEAMDEQPLPGDAPSEISA